MADSHPYISGPGNIAQMVAQLRNSFPAVVSSSTLKKLGLAPKNESYVINALQFVGVIDAEGKKTDAAAKVFSNHKDDDFFSSFEALIKKAYSGLFELHSDASWSLENDALITFFRQSDQTSAAIGKRQANTFKVFAALSGHGEVPVLRGSTSKSDSGKKTSQKPKKKSKVSSKKQKTEQTPDVNINSAGGANLGLTVRVEINLPSDGSKETYNNIFKSIKENLLNG